MLTILHMPGATDEAAANAIARFARAVQATVIVAEDAATPDGSPSASMLVTLALADAGTHGVDVESASDDNHRLLLHACATSALGRSRAGGGGKVLRWAAFLTAAETQEEPAMPIPPPSALPPSLSAPCGAIAEVMSSLPAISTRWALRMLACWCEDISEASALASAADAGKFANRETSDIGEWARTGTAADEANSEIARPSRVSPFLQSGMLSARQALHLGVRRRDLLWRDWSHLCYTLLAPLRAGSPVISPMDGCCRRSAGLEPAAEAATSKDGPRGTATRDVGSGNNGRSAERVLPANLQACVAHLGHLSEQEAFDAWCVGGTGAPVVDAGMRQLWVEGWMPRRVRLLCACCLTEGMGLDWRLGRDWFARTLIDHDRAINEMMWQNAGLCGVDPFYVSLRWEEAPDEAMDAAASWPWEAYVRHWLSAEMRWPPHLRAATRRSCPSLAQLREVASARRVALRPEYKLAGLVGRTGVRVDVRGAGAEVGGSGAVLGVGKLTLSELGERLASSRARASLGASLEAA